eukprot:6207420-Pleurochrysis_carterae.AAC.2
MSRDSTTGRSWTDGRPNCLRGKTVLTSLLVCMVSAFYSPSTTNLRVRTRTVCPCEMEPLRTRTSAPGRPRTRWQTARCRRRRRAASAGRLGSQVGLCLGRGGGGLGCVGGTGVEGGGAASGAAAAVVDALAEAAWR